MRRQKIFEDYAMSRKIISGL